MTANDVFEVLTTPVPALSRNIALGILRDHYKLSGELEILASERDLNFLLTPASGARCVLKIANSAEDPAVTAFQSEALQHIANVAPGLPVPRLLPTVNGDNAVEIVAEDGRTHVVRLVSWLDGTPLQYVDREPGYASSLGSFLAKLGRALRDFAHPASAYSLLWDLKRAASLRQLLQCVDDDDVRAACARRLDRFESFVLPRLDTVRWQVIHNDLNPSNVLVDPQEPGLVTGVIDFGDLVRSPLVVDVAVATAYLLRDLDDPFADVIEFISAYNLVEPLEAGEIELVYDLLLTRSTMTILIAHWRASRYPENREYILRNESTARKMLGKMSGMSRSDVTSRLSSAISR